MAMLERTKRVLRPVLRPAIAAGIAIGVLWLAFNLVNNLVNLDAVGVSELDAIHLSLLVALLGVAGFWGAWQTGRARMGALAGGFAALLGAAIGIVTLFIITFLFIDMIRQNTFMIDDFQRSGMQSMDVFIVEDALGGAFFGGLLSLLLGATLGAIGGLIGVWVRRLRS